MSTFPVVMEHEDAAGSLDGRPIRSSIVSATAAVLLARGADELIIPIPGAHERDRAAEGVELLPPERRAMVKLVDKDAVILRRVRDYLEPLGRQAVKWPEDAFVSFAESFLYQAAIAAKYKAGVLDSAVEIVRGFVPIINPVEFRGEARFRLAELVSLICKYEPAMAEHVAFKAEVIGSGTSRSVWEIIETAEFNSLVAASGKLGYLKHPLVALRRIRRLVSLLVQRPEAKPLLRIAATGADIAGASALPDGVMGLFEDTEEQHGSGIFHPPFIDLGPARQGIYRVALAETHPSAVPPEGAIYAMERARGGRMGMSWLNVGDEDKLEREAREGLASRQLRSLEAKAAQERFLV